MAGGKRRSPGRRGARPQMTPAGRPPPGKRAWPAPRPRNPPGIQGAADGRSPPAHRQPGTLGPRAAAARDRAPAARRVLGARGCRPPRPAPVGASPVRPEGGRPGLGLFAFWSSAAGIRYARSWPLAAGRGAGRVARPQRSRWQLRSRPYPAPQFAVGERWTHPRGAGRTWQRAAPSHTRRRVIPSRDPSMRRGRLGVSSRPEGNRPSRGRCIGAAARNCRNTNTGRPPPGSRARTPPSPPDHTRRTGGPAPHSAPTPGSRDRSERPAQDPRLGPRVRSWYQSRTRTGTACLARPGRQSVPPGSEDGWPSHGPPADRP